jgi:hypothetical protein
MVVALHAPGDSALAGFGPDIHLLTVHLSCMMGDRDLRACLVIPTAGVPSALISATFSPCLHLSLQSRQRDWGIFSDTTSLQHVVLPLCIRHGAQRPVRDFDNR